MYSAQIEQRNLLQAKSSSKSWQKSTKKDVFLLNCHFPENLKKLCSVEKSIADVCRNIGINRQQFNKYLNGSSTPSTYNMRKICNYFQIDERILMLAPKDFKADETIKAIFSNNGSVRRSRIALETAFDDQTVGMRDMLGYYLVYSRAAGFSDAVLCSVLHLFKHEGLVHSKRVARLIDPETGKFLLSKFEGNVCSLENNVIQVEYETLNKDSIVETIITPQSPRQLRNLRGASIGVSDFTKLPFSTEVVWKSIGKSPDLKKAMKMAGIYKCSLFSNDPFVKKLSLLEAENLSERSASLIRT